MEDNFRNSLIIISAVVIGAIFVHGLWTIRKNKNPYKLKASKEKTKPLKRSFDGGGFDQDGVGKIKVKSQETKEFQNDSPMKLSTKRIIEPEISGNIEANIDQDPDIGSLEMPSFDALEKTMEEIAAHSNQDINKTEHDELSVYQSESVDKKVILEEVNSVKPIYSQPVSRPKPKLKSKIELKRDQFEINFGHENDNEQLTVEEQNTEQVGVQAEVLSLSVVMPSTQIMSGAVLLPTLLTLGLKYGEMNIFHRHQDNAGNGAVTFSLANMMNPGSFDLDTMETFVTQGITLFMMLPNAGNAFDVYQQMLSAAKQLSEEFGAQILDDKRNVVTKQTEQHYVSRIRDFEIKNRAATV